MNLVWLCSKKIFETTLITRLNMAFNFQHFVKNVLGEIRMGLITGNLVKLLIWLSFSKLLLRFIKIIVHVTVNTMYYYIVLFM